MAVFAETALRGSAPTLSGTGTVTSSHVKDLHNTLFGGTLANSTVCQNCGHTSSRTDPFSELPLTFPSTFTPIIDIALVSGDTADVAPPEGYDRLPVNLNQGRPGVKCVYLCVARAKSWEQEYSADCTPITDVMVVTHPATATSPLPAVPDGYDMLTQDMNEGGSMKMFLAFARVPMGCPITALDVACAALAKNMKTPHGFVKLPENVNVVRSEVLFG